MTKFVRDYKFNFIGFRIQIYYFEKPPLKV